MAASIIQRINLALQKFEHAISIILGRGFPPEALWAYESNYNGFRTPTTNKKSPFSLKDIVENGFLWAVPKHRRTVEKRMNRKFGYPQYIWKPLVPKTSILTCTNCGHDYEAGLLCPHCYGVAKKETEEMQAAIQQELGLSPVEKDVIVLYEGEKEKLNSEYWKNQRIVEMPKKRPSWFQQNLLQPTTQQPSESKEVKPTELA